MQFGFLPICRGVCQTCALYFMLLACAEVAGAQSVSTSPSWLAAPDGVTLYVHSDMKYTDFVEPLICALRRVLVAKIDQKDLRLPLTTSLLANGTQYDIDKIADRFARSTALDGTKSTFKYLLFPFDLKDSIHHYAFATTFPQTRVGVVSTARLIVSNDRLTAHERAQTTALRAYKLILKSIARLAGMRGEGCILVFPHNLDELDNKSSDFCAEDHAALVDSGILRPEVVDGCEYVAQRNVDGITAAARLE
jgi:predicted Zn-dependent protease